jgi:phosphocarrier protein
MKKGFVVVRNRAGLHARPASLIAQTASISQSEVSLKFIDLENDIIEVADGKSVMSLIALGATYLANLELVVDGSDEEQVYNHIVTLFEQKFEEG